MKNYIVPVIAFVIILAVAIVAMILKTSSKNNELQDLINTKIKHGKYTQVYYSSSGDMNGNVDIMTLDLNNKVLKTEYSPSNGAPIETNEYRIQQEDIDELIKLLDKYNFVAWSKLPKVDSEVALDAPTTSMTITCDENEWYTIDYNSKFPEGGWEIFSNFSRSFFDLVNKGEKTKTYTQEN